MALFIPNKAKKQIHLDTVFCDSVLSLTRYGNKVYCGLLDSRIEDSETLPCKRKFKHVERLKQKLALFVFVLTFILHR